MGHINTLATLKINGSYSQEKQFMIKDFIYKNDVDRIFLHVVVTEYLDKIPGYTTLYNVCTEKRGRVIITRDSLFVTRPEQLPNGRGLACRYHHTLLVNVYAPSGNTHRKDRRSILQ
jgi:hypothetical protein